MKHFRLSTLCLLTFLAANVAFAQAPRTISYQGRLTDAAGDPVSDGAYNCNFRIYDDEFAGVLLWEEVGAIVNTSGGLFTTTLGAPTAFPINPGSDVQIDIFVTGNQLWLEIEVDGETISPRTGLKSVPYAIATRDISGRGIFDSDVGIETNSEYSMLKTFGWDGDEMIRLWGPGWGEILLSDAGPFLGSTSNETVSLSAGFSSGGSLLLRDGSGAGSIALYGGAAGNSSVNLPDNAIDADEMLNEPGVAHGKSFAFTSLSNSDNAVDFATVTLTLPEGGYVQVDGHANFQFSGSLVNNFAWMVIDTAAGKALTSYDEWSWAGASELAGTGNTWGNISFNKFYFLSAGTYTFRIAGNGWGANDVSASTAVWNRQITATYFPTSYGAVASSVSSSPGFGKPLGVEAMNPTTNHSTTVDLRQLELSAKNARIKAKDAQIEALKAERKLQDAKQIQGSK